MRKMQGSWSRAVIIIPVPMGTAAPALPRAKRSAVMAKKRRDMSRAIFLNMANSFSFSRLVSESKGLSRKICRAAGTTAQKNNCGLLPELTSLTAARDRDRSRVEEIKQSRGDLR